jgi:serine protease Do
MKQVFRKFPILMFTAALALPASLVAQDTRDKEVKEKKEAEQIIITRKGDKDDKVVIEVNGDKVIVNGKEIKESEKDGDVSVRRHKIKDVWAFGGDGLTGTWNSRGNNDAFRMYSLGENRAMLGVSTNQADKGAEIETVTEGSAAEKAGLKKGDVIKAVDDKKIETPDDLSEEIKDHKPGDKVSITFMRDKKEQKVTAELGKWKGVSSFSYTPGQNFDVDLDFEHLVPKIQTYPRMIPGQSWSWSGGGPKLGVSVQDTEDGNGVSVIEVDEDGNAAKAGIKEDDIITEVDGKAVKSADEVARLIQGNKEKGSVKVKLLRKGKTETVDIKIPRKLKTADL